jgi:acetyl esterase/lipase
LSAAGFLCFSINYRLDDDVILNQPAVFNGRRTGIASDQIDDFKTAIRAARSDPRCNGKVYLLGGSAGASNAMVTAVTGTVGDDKPDGVICLSGGFDLTDYTGFPAANPPSIRPIVQDGEMYANVGRPAGSNPPPPPALTDPPLDPSYTVPMHAVSAVAQTIANVPPTLLVNGTVEFMPVHQVDVMITALQNAGTPTFTTYPATPSNYQKNILPSDKHSWDNWLLPVATGSSVLVKDEVIEFLHRIDS